MYGGTTADAVRALTGALGRATLCWTTTAWLANDAMDKTKVPSLEKWDIRWFTADGLRLPKAGGHFLADMEAVCRRTGASEPGRPRARRGHEGGFATEIKKELGVQT